MKALYPLLVILSLFVIVTPVHAAPLHEVKPVCTEKHGFMDRLLGKCVNMDNTTAPVNLPYDSKAGDEMTKENPVHEETESWLCKWSTGNWDHICK